MGTLRQFWEALRCWRCLPVMVAVMRVRTLRSIWRDASCCTWPMTQMGIKTTGKLTLTHQFFSCWLKLYNKLQPCPSWITQKLSVQVKIVRIFKLPRFLDCFLKNMPSNVDRVLLVSFSLRLGKKPLRNIMRLLRNIVIFDTTCPLLGCGWSGVGRRSLSQLILGD